MSLRLVRAFAVAGSLTTTACLHDFTGTGGSGAGGSTTSMSEASSTSSSSSTGGSCDPGTNIGCYTGTPADTEGVGICKAGSQTCNVDGTGYDACTGDVTPKLETCDDDRLDEDCDHADCVTHAWRFGDGADQTIDGVARDSMGNVFIAGTMAGTISFDATHAITATGTQIYLAKLDPTGGYLWAKVFASTGVVAVSGITVDNSDNILITGTWDGSGLTFATPLSCNSFTCAYVAKLANDGTHIWSRTVEVDDDNSAAAPAVDSAGNVYVWGRALCDFGCQVFTDSFILQKYSSAGTLVWAKRYTQETGTSVRRIGGVAVDPFDTVWVVGSFYGSEGLGGSPVMSAGGFDILVGKINNSTGNTIGWAKYGDSTDQFANAVASDSAGNIYVAGGFDGHLSVGNTVLSKGGLDMYVFQIKANMAGGWVKDFGSGADETVRALAISGTKLVFAGSSTGSIDFGGGTLTGAGDYDISLVKLDTAQGAYAWSRLFDDGGNQYGNGLVLDTAGDVLLAGTVSEAIDLGGGPIQSNGSTDGLLALFAP